MEILFNDFKKQYSSIKEEIDTAIQEVLNSWWFILWKQVSFFEEEFAKKNWSKYCVWVWNWFDALKISLMALW
jgi:dTDP-4-amino-4,6-dideoxygalactose transaminase